MMHGFHRNYDFNLLNREGQQLDCIPNTTDNSSFVLIDDGFINIDYELQILQKMERSGRNTKIMDTKPLHPLDIGEALDGNILVTLVDELSGSRMAASQRKTQMVTPSGEVLHTYEFEGDGSTPVFTTPCRPAQNLNSNVCVVNRYEEDGNVMGSICCFYEDGELKFVYSGIDDDFIPRDICFDSLCNILCVSSLDACVHVISSEGTFIRYLLTHDTCVQVRGHWPYTKVCCG